MHRVYEQVAQPLRLRHGGGGLGLHGPFLFVRQTRIRVDEDVGLPYRLARRGFGILDEQRGIGVQHRRELTVERLAPAPFPQDRRGRGVMAHAGHVNPEQRRVLEIPEAHRSRAEIPGYGRKIGDETIEPFLGENPRS